MGATLAARRAGSHAATTVTTMPVSIDTSTVRGRTTDGPDGSSTPKADMIERRPLASPTPSTTPALDAKAPMSSASSRIDRITWRRLAPMARSSAVSRVRWATVMVNVL